MKTLVRFLIAVVLCATVYADGPLDFQMQGLKIGAKKEAVMKSHPSVRFSKNQTHGIDVGILEDSKAIPQRIELRFLDGILIEFQAIYSGDAVQKVGGSIALVEALTKRLGVGPDIVIPPSGDGETVIKFGRGWSFVEVSRLFTLSSTTVPGRQKVIINVSDINAAKRAEEREENAKPKADPGF